MNSVFAGNEIGESGLQALLKAVQYQTTLTLDSRSSGTGLMRLCLTVRMLNHTWSLTQIEKSCLVLGYQ